MTLATAPALSPSRLETSPEPVFSKPSVALPPASRPPRLEWRSLGSRVSLIRPNNLDAPPAVEASLHAIPAREGITVPIACWVLAGVSPMMEEILETTSGVTRLFAVSMRFVAIAILRVKSSSEGDLTGRPKCKPGPYYCDEVDLPTGM